MNKTPLLYCSLPVDAEGLVVHWDAPTVVFETVKQIAKGKVDTFRWLDKLEIHPRNWVHRRNLLMGHRGFPTPSSLSPVQR